MQAQRSTRDYSERVAIARQIGVALGNGLVEPERRRGRGAASNETGRFEPTRRGEKSSNISAGSFTWRWVREPSWNPCRKTPARVYRSGFFRRAVSRYD